MLAVSNPTNDRHLDADGCIPAPGMVPANAADGCCAMCVTAAANLLMVLDSGEIRYSFGGWAALWD